MKQNHAKQWTRLKEAFPQLHDFLRVTNARELNWLNVGVFPMSEYTDIFCTS